MGGPVGPDQSPGQKIAPRQRLRVAVADEHALVVVAAGLHRRAEVVHLDLRADAEYVEPNQDSCRRGCYIASSR